MSAPLRVRVDGDAQLWHFERGFEVGRDATCALPIDDARISRRHLRIEPGAGGWRLVDLGSLNGTRVNGALVASASVCAGMQVELGGGPRLSLEMQRDANGSPDADRRARVAVRARQALGGALRRAWAARRIRGTGIVAAVLAVVVGVTLWSQAQQRAALREVRATGVELFHEMKSLELEVAALESSVVSRREAEAHRARAADLRRLRARYDAYVEGTIDSGGALDDVDALIARIARVFGESELAVPEKLQAEVKRYIAKWQGSKRFAHALARLDDSGHKPAILRALEAEGLPRHFLYLALQESNFDPLAVGPNTRYGHAKGMWQFIAPTARRYGLDVGALADTRRIDPRDQRFDVPRASRAAAAYLADIYTTEAQASGLLVMASYNWGEHNIVKRLGSLPADPRRRNFVELLAKHRIPEETYDYVLHIFAAAVIGENPALFGFDFQPPLES